MEERPSGRPAATSSAGENMLLRRAGAAFVDLLTVFVVVAITVARVAESFPAIGAVDGTVGFSPDDQQRINEIAGILSRGHLVGETLYAFSTGAVLWVLGATLIAGLLAGALVPILTGGRSLGKSLFGLRVLSADGQPSRPGQHLIRTLAAVADLMPVVVPGLTGYAFAVSNQLHQRLGDRLAGTIVVERTEPSPKPPRKKVEPEVGKKQPPTPRPRAEKQPTAGRPRAKNPRAKKQRPPRPKPPVHAPPRPSRQPRPKTVPPDVVPAAQRPRSRPPARAGRPTIHQQHSPIQNSSLNAGWLPPDLVGSTTTVPSRPDVRMAVEVRSARARGPRPKLNGDLVKMSDSTTAPEPFRSGQEQSVVGRVPVEERSQNPYPKPSRTADPDEGLGKTDDYDSLTLPESSLSAMPLTNTALFEALGLSDEEIAGLNLGPETVQPEPTQTEPAPFAPAEPAPTPPAEPAPAMPAPVKAAAPAAPAPVQAVPLAPTRPDTAAESRPATVEVAEGAVATRTEIREPEAEQSSGPAPNRRAPIWSDDWDAWIYWDTTLRGWFRHDLDNDTWVALSED